MDTLNKIKELLRARIGLYSIGLHAYWDQFPGLLECLTEYNAFIAQRLSGFGEVYNFGMVDTEEKGREAGEYFNRNNVDIVFSHAATYCTSACVLPVHRLSKAPAVVLDLQPAPKMAYEITGTDRWLAQCVACCVPEISSAMARARIPSGWSTVSWGSITRRPSRRRTRIPPAAPRLSARGMRSGNGALPRR